MLTSLKIRQHQLQLPIFLPDATYGVVRGLSAAELNIVKTKAAVVNAYHLKDHPGVEILDKFQGVANFMNFSGLITSDSGGFQLFSLIQKNPELGKITDQGIVLYTGPKKQRKKIITPEDIIKIQFNINSDIMICLDDFTPPQTNQQRAQKSVERTITWAKRSKQEFNYQIKKRQLNDQNRPHLYAPIQGHDQLDLIKQCAQALVDIGFDGYGLGGWPFKDNGDFDYLTCLMKNHFTPNNQAHFALGIGKPENIVILRLMGYDIFDCVLPTRDARHQRLYVFKNNPAEFFSHWKTTTNTKKIINKIMELRSLRNPDDLAKAAHKINFTQQVFPESWYEYLYIGKGKYQNDQKPISPYCQCYTCQHYSRAYLRHLFKIKDLLAYKLASIHNLYFYNQLMEELQTLHSPKLNKS